MKKIDPDVWIGLYIERDSATISLDTWWECVLDEPVDRGCAAVLGLEVCPTFEQLLDRLGWGIGQPPPTEGAVVHVHRCDDPAFIQVEREDWPAGDGFPDVIRATFGASGEMVQIARFSNDCCGDNQAVWCCDGVHPTNRLIWGLFPDPWYLCSEELDACADFGRCFTLPYVPEPHRDLSGCGCRAGGGEPGAAALLLLAALRRRRPSRAR